MHLSEEQVLALAPDESSKKSGKELSNPAKWVSKGANEVALWGECQGSGSKPYQTQVDVTNIAFKCSCPSRKFPCKHGIGLLLLYARQQPSFTDTTAPAWVSDWLSKRTERQEKQEEKKDKPVDEAAQAKRQQARQQKVEDGIQELRLWMKDIVRNGLVNIPEKGSQYFENIARRMVDAQASGLAGMVRALGNLNFYQDGWQPAFLDQLARLYLVTSGFLNSPSLPPELLQDVRTWIGFTQNQEALKEQTGITDTWLVLGKQSTEEDNLVIERNWLFGVNSNTYALVLQFIVRGQSFNTVTITPGIFIEAELVFFPSASPLRAIIKRQINTHKATPSQAFDNWQAVADTETTLSSVLPFRHERPYIIKDITLVQHQQQWWLQDASQQQMKLGDDCQHVWKLLSLSGGEPLSIAVVGKEQSFVPVGVWHANEYKLL